MRRASLVIVVLALLAAAVAVYAPAGLVGARVERLSGGRITLAEPDGTVWRGRGVLAADPGSRLPFAWSIDAWPLLRGELHLRLLPYDSRRRLPRGEVTLGRGKVALREIELEFPADLLSAAAADNAIRAGGEIRLATSTVDWAPPAGNGKFDVEWRDARIAAPGGAAMALGKVNAVISAADGGFAGSVVNEGGDLDVRGTAGWQMDGRIEVSLLLVPRDPDNALLAGLLAAVGTPEGGAWRVRWRAALR